MSFARELLQHAAVVFAYAIGTLLFAAATAIVWPFAIWWWHEVSFASRILEGFVRGALIFITYLLWGITLLTVIAIVRNVTRLSVPEGRITMRSWATAQFYIYNILVTFARYFFLAFTRSTTLNVLFYRAMGAKIGRRVIINTVHVYDLNLLTIGDDATIGGSAVVMGHVGAGNRLHLGRVVIGKGASVGESSIVFPGAVIGDGAIVGAGSVVPKDFVIPPGTVWMGVPVKQVG